MILQRVNLITRHACLAVLQDLGQGPLQSCTATIPVVPHSPASPAFLLVLPQILVGLFTLALTLSPLSDPCRVGSPSSDLSYKRLSPTTPTKLALPNIC